MFKNNKILILGFARSGYEAAKLLIERDNEVILNDAKTSHDENQIKELEEKGVKLILGSHPDDLLDTSFDYLIKNPGVPIDHKYVLKAKELNIEVINEVEMAYRLFPEGIKLIAITGTNGKTTTTTLIHEIIKQAKLPVHLTGNIGYPLCSFLNKLKKGDIVVMETSCQQLENLEQFHPNIAVMTNLSPAHIDFLKTYENYKNVKTKIFKNQTSDDIAILNIDNQDVLMQTKSIKSKVKYFSSSNEINGCYIKENAIYYYDEKIIDVDEIKLVGKHNYENIMCAIMVAKELNIKNEYIKEVLKTFSGVEHRLEYVKTINNITFYNDSKATNIKSTQIALSSFKTPIILIMGGLERGQDFNELTPYIKNVKLIVCYGENKLRIKDFADSLNIKAIVENDLKQATKKAYANAQEKDTILLSPASASWDQYKCFEDRGCEYKNQIKEIENENNRC